jgi:hypothetical protein
VKYRPTGGALSSIFSLKDEPEVDQVLRFPFDDVAMPKADQREACKSCKSSHGFLS